MGEHNQIAPSIQRRMQAAGNNVMRYSSQENFRAENGNVNRRIQNSAPKLGHHNSFNFRNSFHTPERSKFCNIKWVC